MLRASTDTGSEGVRGRELIFRGSPDLRLGLTLYACCCTWGCSALAFRRYESDLPCPSLVTLERRPCTTCWSWKDCYLVAEEENWPRNIPSSPGRL